MLLCICSNLYEHPAEPVVRDSKTVPFVKEHTDGHRFRKMLSVTDVWDVEKE